MLRRVQVLVRDNNVDASLNGRNINVKRGRKVVTKTPRDIIGAENVTALKHAGFVVVRLSALSKLRANVKSVLDILSGRRLETIGSKLLRCCVAMMA